MSFQSRISFDDHKQSKENKIIGKYVENDKSFKKQKNLRKEKKYDGFIKPFSVLDSISKLRKILKNFFGRTSAFTSFQKMQRASFTVEAAFLLPMFLTALVLLIYLLEIMAIQIQVQSGLAYAAKRAMYETAVVPMLQPSQIEKDVVYAIGSERLNRSAVKGGSAGVRCDKSVLSQRTGVLSLWAEYEVRLPFPEFVPVTLTYQTKLRAKSWTGFVRDPFETPAENTVYVTENGTVYHRDYHCTYLDLSIRSEQLGFVEQLRNQSGGRYRPCEKCGKKNGNTVFITNYGDKYHFSRSCSGLKRQIYAVPIGEAVGKGACAKCGKQE